MGNATKKKKYLIAAISLVVLFIVIYFFIREKEPRSQVYPVIKTEAEILDEYREELIMTKAIDDVYFKLPALDEAYIFNADSLVVYPDKGLYRADIWRSGDHGFSLHVSVYDFKKSYYNNEAGVFSIVDSGQHVISDQALIREILANSQSGSPDNEKYQAYSNFDYLESDLNGFQQGDLIRPTREFYQALCENSEICPGIASVSEIEISGVKGIEILDEPIKNYYQETETYLLYITVILFKNDTLYYFKGGTITDEFSEPKENKTIKEYRELISDFAIK